MMRALSDTLASYREAHRLIWKGRIWPMLVAPVLLTMIYVPAMIMAGFSLGGVLSLHLAEWFPWLGDGTGWFSWLMQGLMLVVFAVFAYFTFRIVVMLLYLPFLEFLIELVEKRLLGHSSEDPKRWYHLMGRAAVMVSVILVFTAGLTVVSLLASLIPVVGTLVVMLCVLPLQFFLTGVGYLDPYLDRNGYSVRQSLGLLRRHFLTVIAFDAVGSALLLIPVIGWFLGPTYSVVAAVVLGIRLDERETENQSQSG